LVVPPPIGPDYGHADWWFDRSSGSLCWYGGDDFSLSLGVDLDGNHSTVASSSFGFNGPVGWNVAPEIAIWDPGVSNWDQYFVHNASGRIVWFAEREILHPIPESRGGSEVFHFFSRLRDPPTDFVVGLRAADANGTSLPITSAFWISNTAPGMAHPGNWTMIDPANPEREGSCRPYDWPRSRPVASLVASNPVAEGEAVLLDASASADADGDPLQFRWDVESDGTWDTPYSADPTASHTWGDDFAGNVTVEVFDGLETATAVVVVIVGNAPPAIGPVGLEATGRSTAALRVAGEKFHDITATVLRNGTAVSGGRIVRMPGSPDDQLLDLGTEVAGDIVKVVYTPLDDPVNGRVWGATPAWLILGQGGNETRLHHTFNARHDDTWVWTVDLDAYVKPSGVELTATATDPGSDDLVVTIDWGDGLSETHFFPNNASAFPDTDPSPDVNPRSITPTDTHAYAAAGTYTITVTVGDDDGGATALTLVVTL